MKKSRMLKASILALVPASLGPHGFGPASAAGNVIASRTGARNATSGTWRSNAAGAGATAAIVGSFRNHCL